MSCGSSCPCHFKWLVDTQGSKRDPLNSEKAWLDFAVRLLSREVVRKCKGQETVWSERCKPQWWDKDVGLPWKNPTSNPKDTKEVLERKYTALEKKLREEDRFPLELEDEARLWREGKHRELFLQTSLASLLGKVTGIHVAVIDALERVKELKAQVNLSLVNDLQQCLSSTLQATENLHINGHSIKSSPKRPSSSSDNGDIIPEKRQKFENKILHSNCQQISHSKVPLSVEASEQILSYKQELVRKRKSQTNEARSVKKYVQKLQPKPTSLVPNVHPLVTMTTGVSNTQSHGMVPQPVMSPNRITPSQEELSHLLLGNLLVGSEPAVWSRVKMPSFTSQAVLPNSSTEVTACMPGSSTEINDFLSLVSVSKEAAPPDAVGIDANSYDIIESGSTDMFCDTNRSNTHHHLILSQDKQNSTVPKLDILLSPRANNDDTILSASCDSFSSQVSIESPFDENFAQMAYTTSPTDTCSRSSSDRMGSSGEWGPIHHNFSDTDGSTEQSMLDLDDIYSSDEQEQLWKEDGSYLLDRFLDNLEASAHGGISKSHH